MAENKEEIAVNCDFLLSASRYKDKAQKYGMQVEVLRMLNNNMKTLFEAYAINFPPSFREIAR